MNRKFAIALAVRAAFTLAVVLAVGIPLSYFASKGLTSYWNPQHGFLALLSGVLHVVMGAVIGYAVGSTGARLFLRRLS